MPNLQMVDLKRQYLHIKSDIDTAISRVLESSAFIGGPDVQEFSKEIAQYLNIKHAIPCGNGTDAIQIALMALGLQPGDEVITPSFTFIATVEVVALLGLKPVFVDVDPKTFTITADTIKGAINERTKCIIPVHLYGQSCDMEPILALAKEHNLYVVEDNAQAIGGSYTFSDGRTVKTGTMGHISCTSFFPSKNLGCYGDGGAVFTNDDQLAERIKMIANHGQKVRYYHEMVGVNSRLDSIQAAILRVKLKYLDQYCKARTSAADYYDQAFSDNANIETPFRALYSQHVFHQYTLKLHGVDRQGLIDYLASHGIPSMLYYPVPCHKQNMLKAFADGINLPITDELNQCVLSLPMHTELSDEELEFITHHVLAFINK